MEKYIVIDNYCGWPCMTKLPGGELLMTVFNKPCHGAYSGEVETFASSDGGYLWKYRGTPIFHGPGETRCAAACGHAAGGDYIALVNGWDGRGEPPADSRAIIENPWRTNLLETAVCRSSDSGKTFVSKPIAYNPPDAKSRVIPFGNIITLPGGRLVCPAYSYDPKITALESTAYALFSDDDGKTFGNARTVAAGRFNEIAVTHAGGDRLLAAVRTNDCGLRLELFVSDDLGKTWGFKDVLTAGGMYPANLITLRDGAVLLSYGIRFGGLYGNGIMLSRDAGDSWTTPAVLNVTQGASDGGYPSSVQLDDGTIATAYYSNACGDHGRYHIGMLHWRLEEFFT